jgi:hypothetical protein
MDPPASISAQFAFTNLANYLHNQFEGDFCARFGYKKPKDFALELERNGYVKLSQKGLGLYMNLTEKMINECNMYDQGMTVPKSGEKTSANKMEMDLLQLVLQELEKELHYPTEEKISIKINSVLSTKKIDIQKLLKKSIEEKKITMEESTHGKLFWPVNKRWEAIHPEDPRDLYSDDQWKDFNQAIYLIPSSERIAQTRYHIARNLGNIKGHIISTLSQAQREHMVQLAVQKKILTTIFTSRGLKISIPEETNERR